MQELFNCNSILVSHSQPENRFHSLRICFSPSEVSDGIGRDINLPLTWAGMNMYTHFVFHAKCLKRNMKNFTTVNSRKLASRHGEMILKRCLNCFRVNISNA